MSNGATRTRSPFFPDLALFLGLALSRPDHAHLHGEQAGKKEEREIKQDSGNDNNNNAQLIPFILLHPAPTSGTSSSSNSNSNDSRNQARLGRSAHFFFASENQQAAPAPSRQTYSTLPNAASLPTNRLQSTIGNVLPKRSPRRTARNGKWLQGREKRRMEGEGSVFPSLDSIKSINQSIESTRLGRACVS